MDYRICLGTVQLGQCYGVNNALGRQPDQQESFQLLSAAIGYGIKIFDTASTYGDAEMILGKFGINHFPVKVVSKLRPNLPSDTDLVFKEIQASLTRLGLMSLEGYLLHHAEDFYRADILRGLKITKEKGLTHNIGVSVYEPEDAIRVVQDKDIDFIQIPYNVLDQRLDETVFFELAEKNNVTVFARSVFLQGLLLMKKENLPSYLQETWSHIKKFQDIAQLHGFSPAEAALLYSYCHPKIDYVLFGVEKIEQLNDNFRILNKMNKFISCYNELCGQFKNISRNIVIPSLWSR